MAWMNDRRFVEMMPAMQLTSRGDHGRLSRTNTGWRIMSASRRIICGSLSDACFGKLREPSVCDARSGFRSPSRASTRALFEQDVIAAARGHADDDVAGDLTHSPDDLGVDLAPERRISLRIASVQMKASGALCKAGRELIRHGYSSSSSQGIIRNSLGFKDLES
jgi:hypothetical protein